MARPCSVCIHKDRVENIIWLCADHHTMGPYAVHNIGWISFAEKFGLVERFENARRIIHDLQAGERLGCNHGS
jgi:hypothetical protein